MSIHKLINLLGCLFPVLNDKQMRNWLGVDYFLINMLEDPHVKLFFSTNTFSFKNTPPKTSIIIP